MNKNSRCFKKRRVCTAAVDDDMTFFCTDENSAVEMY